jgi:hypothetical protein
MGGICTIAEIEKSIQNIDREISKEEVTWVTWIWNIIISNLKSWANWSVPPPGFF